MAIYKGGSNWGTFIGIYDNNQRVGLNMFLSGLFLGVSTSLRSITFPLLFLFISPTRMRASTLNFFNPPDTKLSNFNVQLVISAREMN